MKKTKNIAIIVLSYVLYVCDICVAATITVGPDANYNFSSIQEAIDDANHGDEIVVAPGTYYEGTNFLGKAIRIYSSHGPDDTFINGTGDYHVVQCVSGEGPDTILEGFTITGGNANGDLEDGFGGGMYNVGSSPTVINCIFRANTAKRGGGMYNDTANPILMDCLFEDNSTHNGAGGSDPGGDGGDAGHGGGMYNDHASPFITQCIFRNNKAGNGGAGATGESASTLFGTGGKGGAGGRGGDGAGIYNYDSSPQLQECTFTSNGAGAGGNGGKGGRASLYGTGGDGGKGGVGGWGAGIYNMNSSPQVENCIFSGNGTGKGGNGGEGGGLVHGNGGDGEAGGNGAGMFSDGGSATVINCTFNNNTTANGGNGGDNGPGDDPGLGANGGRGAGVYNIRSASEFIGCHFTENRTGNGGWNGGSGGNGAGMYNSNCSSVAVFDSTFRKNITGNGSSGGSGGDGSGVCNVASGLCISNGSFVDNITGSGAKSGRGGHGAGIFNANNVDRNLMISGCTFAGNITGRGGNGISIDQGKGISGGPGGSGGSGGGIYNDKSHPTVSDCFFISNVTGNGGHGGNGDWAVPYLMFLYYPTGGAGGDGGSGGDGAGIRNLNSSPTVLLCNFTDNRCGIGGTGGKGGKATWRGKPGTAGEDGNGGAMANQGGSVSVSEAAFSSNQAGRGGGVYNYKGIIELVNCSFSSNRATDSGGGIYNYQNAPTIVGCLFSANYADVYGSAIYTTHPRPLIDSQSYPVITNCTISANNGGIETGAIHNDNSDSIFTNCILWNNIPGEIHNELSTPVVTYCNVKDAAGQPWFGTGCMDTDPLFADVHGRLSEPSPCRTAGSNAAPALPDLDLDGNPRIIGTTVDMGAYEYTTLTVQNMKQHTLYDSIQAAIDAADEGDPIRVLPGTYAESINFGGKAVHLYSKEGPALTIINGTGHYHVVQCVGGEDPNIHGFTITGGNANGPTDADKRGGGMRIVNSSPTVTGCIFKNNLSDGPGGGMYIESGSPVVTHCSFIDNATNSGGGGMYSRQYSSPAITHCIFSGNSAVGGGGGMVNTISTQSKVTNCIFAGNSTAGNGGAIWNYWYSHATLINCTLSQNTAVNGGGIYNSGPSNLTVVNSILWGNSPNQFMNIDGSTPAVSYSSIQGGFAGTGNIEADPLFMDAAGGNLRLGDNSPCIDAGDNNAVPADLATDLDGDERFRDGSYDGIATIDMGAFEYDGRVFNTTTHSVYRGIQNAIVGANHGDRIVVKPGIYYETINFLGKNISLSSTDPNDPSVVAQTILDGQYSGGTVVTFENQESQHCLLDGLTITGGYSHDGAGIYCYGSYPTIKNCVIRHNRAATSIIKVVWGAPGIVGCTVSNNTVWGSSMPDEPSGAVVFFHCPDILLEDCTIRSNRTYGGSAIRFIGEEASFWSTFAVVGCSITENSNLPKPGYNPLRNGGGIYFYGGQLFIEDCYIAGNTTRDPHLSGGGLWIEQASFLEISRSCIINNQAGSGGNGGGIGVYNGSGTIDNCEISGNSCGQFGGGMSGFQGDITDTLISDNVAGHSGGGLYDFYGSMQNCTVSNNASNSAGGGLAVGGWNGGFADITNCVFTNNSAANGGGLSEFAGSVSNCLILGNRATSYGGGLDNCTAALANNIIRQNIAATDGDQLYGGSIPNYSNIQDWSGGGIGNITLDPVFRQAGVWVDKSDPNMVVAPDDPNAVWVEGNYRLRPGSPCIDAGDNAAVPAGVATDLNGWSRFIDDLCTADTGSGTGPIVDMGPYEFLPADMDGSGTVNFADFSVLAAHWQQSGGDCAGADMNCDGTVDLADAAMLLAWWLEGGI